MINVEIQDDYIAITETKDGATTEIVSWIQTEWVEDPQTVVPAIATAIKLAYTDPELLKSTIKIFFV